MTIFARSALTRRSALAMGGALILGAATRGPEALAQEPAFGDAGPIGPATEAALKARGWSDPAFDSRLTLGLPEIVENGANAPVDLAFKDPDPAVFVKKLGLYAEANFTPEIAVYGFSPATGAALRLSVRARLAESQTVLAVAELSDGQIIAAAVPVKVAIGGCAG